MPALDPRQIDDLISAADSPPVSPASTSAGWSRSNSATTSYRAPGEPVLLVVAADHPDGVHAIKAGEGDAFISAGVETVSRFVKGNADAWPGSQNPLFAEAPSAPTAAA